jgi:WD40 repeat protein
MDGRTYRAVLALIDSAPPESRVTLPLDQVEVRTKWWNSRKRTQAWAERYGGGLDRVQQLFKDSHDALEAERQREQAAREAQRESEIKAAKMDAERQKAEAEAALQRTRSRGIRWVAILALALAAVTLFTAYSAWQRYHEAEVKRVAALAIQTRFVASQSKRETTQGNTRAGILLALAALDRQKDLGHYIADPEMALYGALAAHIGETIIGEYDRDQPIEFNLAGRRLLTMSGNNIVILDPKGKPIATLAHETSVREAVFNEDGTRVATASRDGARIWDAGGTLSATLPHPAPVTGIMFSRDGSRVVTAADDNTARVWPVSGGDPVELPHEASLSSAKINGDGSLVVTVAGDKIVRVWDVATRAAKTFQHPDDVTFTAFSPDGARVITICRDRNVRLWNAKTMTNTAIWLHDNIVNSAVFSPDGTDVATATDDQTVRIWDATARPTPQTGLAGPPPASASAALRHEGNLKLVKFNKDGSKLITIADDKVVRLWSARGRKLATLQHKADVEDISFNTEETEILTASDGQLRSWSLQNALERRLMRADDVTSVTMNADGTRILGVSGSTRRLYVWDEHGKEVSAVLGVRGISVGPRLFIRRSLILTRLGNSLRLSDMGGRRIFETTGNLSTVSSDAARIVVQNDEERTLTFWSVSGEQVRAITHDKEVTRLVANRDGSRAATVARDGTVEIWSETGERIIELRPPARQASSKAERPRSAPERLVAFDAALTRILIVNHEDGVADVWDDQHNKAWSPPVNAPVRFAAFSPDGKSLLLGAGTTAQLHNVADERVVTLRHEGEVVQTEFSLDGSRILTISADKTVRLWKGRGDVVAVLRHDRAVRSALFSASGDRVVTIDADNTVRVWESRGRQIAEIPHDGRVSVSMDAGGKRLVTVASNEPRIFNLDKLDDLLAMAASLKLPPLTDDERKRYFVD